MRAHYTTLKQPFLEGPYTVMELGPKRPSLLWFVGPSSIYGPSWVNMKTNMNIKRLP